MTDDQQQPKPPKTIDERLDALAMNVELMHQDLLQWLEHTKQQDQKFDQLRNSVIRAMVAFLSNGGEKGKG